MGVENRDYYREGGGYTDRVSGWGMPTLPPVVKWIIIANVVVFLLQIFITREPYDSEVQAQVKRFQELERDVPRELTEEQLEAFKALVGPVSVVQEWFQLETGKVLRGQVWRVVTSAFCHDRFGILHIFFNMLFLYWFGVTLEAMYGSREFLLFYLASAIFASLAYIGLDLATGGSTPAIGASGAVMGVTMLFAIHFPRHIIYVMYIIPVEVRWIVVLYALFDLHPVLLALGGYRAYTGVAHAAHLGGLAFGFLYWKFHLRLEPLAGWLRTPRWDRLFGSRRGIRVFKPEPRGADRKLDTQVDDILRKIHEHGEASLTDRERETLTAASKKYQQRNRP